MTAARFPPPARDSATLVVVPTYNEAENIGPLLRAVLSLPFPLEVLVVDDGSPDGTADRVEEMAREDPRIHLLRRPGKMGLGSAYLDAFRWALRWDYARVVEMDADFSHDPRHLPALLEASERADLVLGSRYVPGGETAGWTPLRKFISRAGSLYARAILGLSVRDLTGGYKCFRRQVLEAIPLDEVVSEGYAFQIEMTFRALRKGFRVIEVPIRFTDRRVGQSKMSWRIFWEAVRNVWWIRLRL
ncbi:MAG: polyprenol monophosphomannose synthase [Candidatus Tectomicrobia bacterium]|nr:polyprenol monophosphomannose synthase [Candidatus Tectomicrobia bacterium]